MLFLALLMTNLTSPYGTAVYISTRDSQWDDHSPICTLLTASVLTASYVTPLERVLAVLFQVWPKLDPATEKVPSVTIWPPERHGKRNHRYSLLMTYLSEILELSEIDSL